jgi:type II secretory pathway component PulM
MNITADDVTKVVGAMGILLGVFVSLYTVLTSASKTGFEQLERVVKTMETRMAALEQENKDLREWAEALVKQVEDAGLVPVSFRHRGHK